MFENAFIKNNMFSNELNRSAFNKLSKTIYDECGIVLPEAKKYLVEGRIRKRMRTLGHETFDEYVEFLFDSGNYDSELIPLINVITTNKTDFFREAQQFDYMVSNILPQMINHLKETRRAKLNIWSAGCSTGEEPYTLAVVLNEYFEKLEGLDFSIYASDISTDVLKSAALGIYEMEKIDVIPESLKKKYLLRSKDKSRNEVRFVPQIRSKIQFSRINLLESNYNLPDPVDIVFCRNVLIYFDKDTRERVIGNLASKIRKDGYLFLGHSETITGLKLPIVRVASTIYKKQ